MTLRTSNKGIPEKLPPLRQDITIQFNDFDKQHKPYWMIHDPGRNKFFIIGWPEYEILQSWSLGNAQLILEAVNSKTTLEIEMQDIESVYSFLKQNYLLKQSGYEISKTANEQRLFKDDSKISWLIGHYLFFKIPLVHPDKFLTKTKKIGELVFNRYTAYIMLVLAVIAIYQIDMQWDAFIHSFPTVLSWRGLLLYFIAFSGTKLIHELGHAYMCKRYGVPIPSLGVAFLVFWPVLYTDTTLSWRLNNHQRLQIALAGLWVESYVVIIAALVWCNVSNETIQTICFLIITVNFVASLLINASPFMRFDGYFILSDLLHMPNLQPRAFSLTRWQIRRWLFDWPDPAPEKFSPKMHYFLVAYSLFTWIYRLTLYIGIALLVYHFAFKLIGILLFFIEVQYFILAPFINEAKFYYHHKDKFTFNRHTIVTLIVTIFGLLLFSLPVKESINLPATLSYPHQFIYAPEEGILLNKLPSPGTRIAKDKVIVDLSSPTLNNSMRILTLEYKKKLAELRRSAINKKYVSEKNIILSDISSQQSEYKKLYAQYQKLHIRAPFDGVIIEVSSELKPGEVVQKGQWLGDFVKLQDPSIEAFVPQIDFQKINVGNKGHFYPQDIGQAKFGVKVVSVETLNMKYLNCFFSSEIEKNKNPEIAVDTPCYHASDFGGDIPTLPSDEGNLVPVDSTYRVVLVPDKSPKLNVVEAGTVVLETKRSSYAYRVFYTIKKLLVQESEL